MLEYLYRSILLLLHNHREESFWSVSTGVFSYISTTTERNFVGVSLQEYSLTSPQPQRGILLEFFYRSILLLLHNHREEFCWSIYTGVFSYFSTTTERNFFEYLYRSILLLLHNQRGILLEYLYRSILLLLHNHSEELNWSIYTGVFSYFSTTTESNFVGVSLQEYSLTSPQPQRGILLEYLYRSILLLHHNHR